jgi:hypothetical protein
MAVLEYMHGTEYTPTSVALKDSVWLMLPGMLVCEFDRPWADTPFLPRRFHLKAIEAIQILTRFCKSVHIDTRRGAEPEQLNAATSLV